MIVVDASVVAAVLTLDAHEGGEVRDRVRGERLLAPEILDLEVLSVIRKRVISGHLDQRRAALAFEDLWDFSVQRVRHHPLLTRIWELRDNLTPYDAAYVALAELTNVTLITADRRLAGAPGPRCVIEYLGYPP